ncbi:MAG: hypothetical protein IPK90_11490 [Chitinophagaceae bacterium]|nr:hypothetical protein [Chitinophagaceae bacterium]
METINLDELVNEVVDSLKLQLKKSSSVIVTREGDLTLLQGDRLNLLV